MITLDSIEKTFQSKASISPILKNISLNVEPGEIVGVIGKKGAGKTTLLRCVALLERPCQGIVIVDHYSLTTLNASDLTYARQSIGLVTEETYLLDSKTVFENIAFPLELVKISKTARDPIIQSLLSLVGLTDKAHVYPKDLNPLEKKRVALARALVHTPKILLCDDPTSEIEPKSIQAFLQLLKEINERFKTTILIATQEIDVIKTICHRTAVLHQGEIIEESSTLSLFAKPKSALSKEWVKASTRLELPTALRRRLKPKPCELSNPVLRLSFMNTSMNNTSIDNKETLIAHIVQQYYLTIHIMQAHIEHLRDEAIGVMIVEVQDDHHSLEAAIEFLESQSLFVEVLGYATRTH